MTNPSPELIAKMHDAIVLRARLPLVEQRAKRAARVAQDAVDASYLAGLRDGRKHAEELFAAKYADLINAVHAVVAADLGGCGEPFVDEIMDNLEYALAAIDTIEDADLDLATAAYFADLKTD